MNKDLDYYLHLLFYLKYGKQKNYNKIYLEALKVGKGRKESDDGGEKKFPSVDIEKILKWGILIYQWYEVLKPCLENLLFLQKDYSTSLNEKQIVLLISEELKVGIKEEDLEDSKSFEDAKAFIEKFTTTTKTIDKFNL